MFLIGLTGGIAAGKSTVAAVWAKLGAHVIDADDVAREVVRQGESGYKAVVEAFGEEILSADGSIDRKKLAALVFSEPSSRLRLENLLHPLIRERTLNLLAALPRDSVAVYAVPLLVEAKVTLPFDVIVTVEAPVHEQIRRLVANRGMSEAEAKARLSAQVSSAQRANVADHILNSNQSLEHLKSDAAELYRTLVSQSNPSS